MKAEQSEYVAKKSASVRPASPEEGSSTQPFIPVYQPDLGGNVKAYVNECIDSSWISGGQGRFVGAFEEAFADRVGSHHAVTVCNGTVALHLALVALGIGPGDEVIVPTLTYIASANAITYTGATPVFVDSRKDTWQIDPEDVRRCITERTRAIMVVHLYGQPCDMSALGEIARQHRLFVVEDCAEAFGSTFQGQHVGTFGDIATFSFYGNKTITTGEGGMVVTNDKTLYDRCRRFRGQGLAAYREYWHDLVGYNYRMTNVAAAIGLAQLERADEFIERKRALAARYAAMLKKFPLEMHAEAPDSVHSYWMVSVLVESPEHRGPLRAHLKEAGIETRPLFYPVHTMPPYARSYRRHEVAEDLSWRGINLPSWPALGDAEFERIAAALSSYYD
ncbi:DegT/DnrJ/EryC1/StrS family aminotransferase [Variovorax dokdonensis]|uniref:DegT/DnrJ/EryC1/StrS family aminotransferase n=1 Tax=Variovorax dokdonensis TaxID=344883 RepID=A0ABT7N9L6_9BURK|nr:DegT/DnrJ/EryC1/StrS family aminotransferase [Variovorax dokdonensis]MDM0044622.1 DegT/DnrJ/EryC1/StrS family aminotransferase [Variovorax dokdonensis]